MSAGNLREAIDHLSRAHGADPRNSEWATVFGQALLLDGRVEEASRILAGAMVAPAATPRAFFYAGCAAYMSGDHAEALRLARVLLASSSAYWRAWALEGLARHRLGEGEAAMHALRQALEIVPQNPALRIRIAAWIVARRLREGGEVLEDVSEAKRLVDGIGAPAAYVDGCIEDMAGDTRLALVRFDECGASGTAEVQLRRARCLLDCREFARARVLLEGVTRRGSDHPWIFPLSQAAASGAPGDVPAPWAPDEDLLPPLGLLGDRADSPRATDSTESFARSSVQGWPSGPDTPSPEGHAGAGATGPWRAPRVGEDET